VLRVGEEEEEEEEEMYLFCTKENKYFLKKSF
jgi:hypothetical protein